MIDEREMKVNLRSGNEVLDESRIAVYTPVNNFTGYSAVGSAHAWGA